MFESWKKNIQGFPKGYLYWCHILLYIIYYTIKSSCKPFMFCIALKVPMLVCNTFTQSKLKSKVVYQLKWSIKAIHAKAE